MSPLADRDRLLHAALRYAGIGWPVFPLTLRGKVPLIGRKAGGRGVHDATTDPERLSGWWATHPAANVGLAAGAAFWALDVDYKGWEPEGPDGLTSLAALVERFGPLPPTMTQVTGSGGYQFFFKPDERVKNGAAFLPGLDTRAAGGYVVAPPSVHPNGRPYRWRRGRGPAEIEIATAPEWLVAFVEPVEPPDPAPAAAPLRVGHLDRYGQGALERACDAIRRAPIGSQADTLDRQAYGIGRLVAGGTLPAGDAKPALERAGGQMANQPRRRPWTSREIAWRIDRAFAQAAHEPRTVRAG